MGLLDRYRGIRILKPYGSSNIKISPPSKDYSTVAKTAGTVILTRINSLSIAYDSSFREQIASVLPALTLFSDIFTVLRKFSLLLPKCL